MSFGASNFSSTINYTLRAFPYNYRPVNKITDWEQSVLDLISQTGAATYDQLSTHRKHPNKLDSLNKVGLTRKYQLITDNTQIDIAAGKPYTNTTDILKSIVFTQLVLKLKSIDESFEIYSGSIKFLNNLFSVTITRQSDDISILPLLINQTDSQQKNIIIAEKFSPDFSKITTPTRIILDEDLFSENLTFYLPDGSKEFIPNK